MCVRTRKSSSRHNPWNGGMCASTWRITPRVMSACGSWPPGSCTPSGELSLKLGSESGVPKGTPTPRAQRDLHRGELVCVKSYGEILKTLDFNYRNRGLYFDP